MASEEGVVIACHTKAEFDAQISKAKEAGKLVVIDFTATWCGPCRTIAPVFVEYAKTFTQIVFLKVDVDAAELKEVVAEYNVQAMPTFHFVKDGQKVESIVGADKKKLEALIQKHTASASA